MSHRRRVHRTEEKGSLLSEARVDVVPPRIRQYRTKLFQAGLIMLIAVFALLAFFAKQSDYFPADLTITRFLQSLDSVMNIAMNVVSWAGYSPQSAILVAVSSILLYSFRLRWEACVTVLSAVFEELLNLAIKNFIHRPRPSEELVYVLKIYSSYSFPSGHVMFYTVFFGFLWFLVFTLMKHSWVRAALLAVIGSQVILVGVSRIYLGEHWASDALGAYLLGILALVAVIRFYRWGKPRFFVRQPVAGGGRRSS